jgi:hypothetical protein
MSTIYSIVGDVKALSGLIESLTDEETGETRELTDEEKTTFAAWVNEESEAFDSKFDRICKFFKNLKANAATAEAERASLKDEMDRLSKRAKARENEAGRIKDLLWFAFDALGMKKHKTELFSAGIQNTAASVKCDSSFEINLIPSFLYKEPELSATKIKEGLAAGKLYQKPDAENPLERDLVYYKYFTSDDNQKAIEHIAVLPGIHYAQGSTLVVR